MSVCFEWLSEAIELSKKVWKQTVSFKRYHKEACDCLLTRQTAEFVC